MKSKQRSILMLACVALAAVAVGGQGASKTWNFDGVAAGAPGPGFLAGPGEWRVQAGVNAPSKPNVLMQNAKSARPVFNVLLVSEPEYADLDLSIQLLSVAGEIDQGGGVVWRARDAQNYYIARYNPLENNFRVYRVVNGTRTQLQSADVPATAGWRTLRITMKGDAIECYLDGRKLLQATDTTFTGAGKIGVWTKADAQTQFDDLSVSPVKTN